MLEDLAYQESKAYKTENILVLYGDDLFYNEIESARGQVQLIETLRNSESALQIKFSTMAEYFQAVLSENRNFSVYEGDFFPYLSEYGIMYSIFYTEIIPLSWTGFYSSRPELKKKTFEAHSLVRAAEIISALVLKQEFQGYESCIALHHDAITGTCKPEVAEDYFLRLKNDTQASEDIIRYSYSNIITSSLETLDLMKPYKAFVIYNSINWKITKVMCIDTDSRYVIMHDSNGKIIKSQIVPISEKFQVYFMISLQPLSFTTIFMSIHNENCTICSTFSKKINASSITNTKYTLKFNKGLINSISTENSEFKLMEKILSYDSSSGGAYIFRPLVISM